MALSFALTGSLIHQAITGEMSQSNKNGAAYHSVIGENRQIIKNKLMESTGLIHMARKDPASPCAFRTLLLVDGVHSNRPFAENIIRQLVRTMASSEYHAS